VSATVDFDDADGQGRAADEDDLEALRARALSAEEEVTVLRRRLQESPRRVQTLEEKLLETKGQLAQAVSQNEKLTFTLQTAKEHVANLREEVEKLTQPPSAYGTYLGANEDGTVDVFSGGRKMRVTLHPDIEPGDVQRGNEVVLNESLNVILAREGEGQGEVVVLKELLDDGARALVYGRADEERVAELSDALIGVKLRAGDTVLMESRTGLLIEKLDRPEVEELVLEEVPDVTYADVGGLDDQIEAITDAVELPYLYRELYAEHRLPAPKGILLYGPPGCGKTLIAKAVANSLAKKVAEVTGNTNTRSYFLNIKGPELLNKYVGETERQIRLVFQRAREKSEEGVPVIVFFDEMDSLFRTRGTGISSDMESTIVPQLLAEIDGVETLKDVIVIGASNREDLIDPAILRPGRLDVKIRIERPNEQAATQIFGRYLTADLPLDAEEVRTLGGGDPAKATQAMTLEWVKCRRGPRTSQIPSSGCCQTVSRKPTTARSRSHAACSGSSPTRRERYIASSNSPYTSSWNCLYAPLPTRTGRDPSYPGSQSTSHSIRRRSPAKPYMICSLSGLPAAARNNHSRQARASSL